MRGILYTECTVYTAVHSFGVVEYKGSVKNILDVVVDKLWTKEMTDSFAYKAACITTAYSESGQSLKKVMEKVKILKNITNLGVNTVKTLESANVKALTHYKNLNS